MLALGSLLPGVAGALAASVSGTAAPMPPPSFTVDHVRAGRSVALRSRPDGRVIARVGARTPFGSPRTLGVAARRGAWVGVTDSTLPNNRLAWVPDRTSALVPRRTRVSLRVNLARRQLALVDGSHVEKQIPVGIGAPGSPTPAGRFAVTDKLPGGRYSPSYGCCILALSGHQPRVPAGWQGGNRLAIHGGSVGSRSSSGCLHAPERDLMLLMRKVPLGTPVAIRKR
jgi:lipoprotein-anchoring transpeptidase ErfK/SrfK